MLVFTRQTKNKGEGDGLGRKATKSDRRSDRKARCCVISQTVGHNYGSSHYTEKPWLHGLALTCRRAKAAKSRHLYLGSAWPGFTA